MARQKHGQGEATLYKESFMGLCLGWYIDHVWEEDYYHIDLNAGPGHNDRIAMPTVGSPITFMRQAQKRPQNPIVAWFVEKNQTYAEMLQTRIRRQYGHEFNGQLFARIPRQFEIRIGDNEIALAQFAKMIPRSTAPGSVIWDPNGYTRHGGALSLSLLQDFLAAFPRFIVLINFGWAFAKMGRPVHTNRDPTWNCTRVNDFISMRPYWLISEKAQRHVFLCGSSWRFPEGRARVPAFQHTSKEGRSILADVDTVKDQSRGRQRRAPKLPLDEDE